VLAQLVNFTSIVFVSFTDFIVPFALYVVLQRRQQAKGGAYDAETADTKTENLLNATSAGSFTPGTQYSNLDDSETWPELEPHHALPKGFGRESPETKVALSQILGFLLTVLSVVGLYLSIVQGSWEFDSQTCSLVGN
jgi:hypothetical protein